MLEGAVKRYPERYYDHLRINHALPLLHRRKHFRTFYAKFGYIDPLSSNPGL